MKTKVIKKVKSRDEILNTLTKIEYVGDKTYGTLKDNKTIGQIDINSWLWNLCGNVLEVSTTTTASHKFDYRYFDFPKDGDKRTDIPVVYFMEQWLENVNDEVSQVQEMVDCSSSVPFNGE